MAPCFLRTSPWASSSTEFPSHVARPPAQPPLPSSRNVPGPSAAACVPSSSWDTISLFLDPIHSVPAGTHPGIPLVGTARTTSTTCDPKAPKLSRPSGPHALEPGRPGAASGAHGSKMTEGKPPPRIRRPQLKPWANPLAATLPLSGRKCRCVSRGPGASRALGRARSKRHGLRSPEGPA